LEALIILFNRSKTHCKVSKRKETKNKYKQAKETQGNVYHLLYFNSLEHGYLVSGLYPSSSVQKNKSDKKTQRFGDWICLRPQVDRAG
jgi:hypothetical protein